MNKLIAPPARWKKLLGSDAGKIRSLCVWTWTLNSLFFSRGAASCLPIFCFNLRQSCVMGAFVPDFDFAHICNAPINNLHQISWITGPKYFVAHSAATFVDVPTSAKSEIARAAWSILYNAARAGLVSNNKISPNSPPRDRHSGLGPWAARGPPRRAHSFHSCHTCTIFVICVWTSARRAHPWVGAAGDVTFLAAQWKYGIEKSAAHCSLGQRDACACCYLFIHAPSARPASCAVWREAA